MLNVRGFTGYKFFSLGKFIQELFHCDVNLYIRPFYKGMHRSLLD